MMVGAVPSTIAYECINGMETTIEGKDLLGVEFNAPITASATVAAVAPGHVEVQIEVEEFIGVNG